jgi:hypothetical protein
VHWLGLPYAMHSSHSLNVHLKGRRRGRGREGCGQCECVGQVDGSEGCTVQHSTVRCNVM